MTTFEQKYQAIVSKDSAYEGIFIVAVKTTGIFCRPVCPARKPKPENVIFYDNCKEAILNGFRPCKVCKPLEVPDGTPDYIEKIIKEIHENTFKKIKDWDLRQRGIEPSKIRRWFKQHHNMTFHSYQRMMRINMAFSKLNNGEKITNTAFDVGFESISGFNDRFKNVFGTSAGKNHNQSVINIVRFTTPLGPMFAGATDEGLCLMEFTDRRMLETELKELQKYFKAIILPGSNKHIDKAISEMNDYFKGIRQSFSVELDAPGTAFQKEAWSALQKIPYGTTVSYKQQAFSINKPKSIRPIGSANGHNRISIIIPCHRVIGENGNLTGYGGGLARKQWLIDFERKNRLL